MHSHVHARVSYSKRNINIEASIYRSLVNVIFKEKKTRKKFTVLNFATSSSSDQSRLRRDNLKIRRVRITHARTLCLWRGCRYSRPARNILQSPLIFLATLRSCPYPLDSAQRAAREKDDKGARWIVTTLN